MTGRARVGERESLRQHGWGLDFLLSIVGSKKRKLRKDKESLSPQALDSVCYCGRDMVTQRYEPRDEDLGHYLKLRHLRIS